MSTSASNFAWSGVMPAITTPFNERGFVDHSFLGRHAAWLVDEGCTGIVTCGSLGEGGSLSLAEKAQIFSTCVTAVGRKVPVIAAVSALTTKEAVDIAKLAEDHGCSGLMVLPPYVYVGDWREMKAHVGAVLSATKLSAMLYNNPIAYKVDFLPHQVVELQSEYENLHAIKESSADVRRIAALRELAGDGIRILVGVDDLIVEALLMGAEGWVAGLVNAFPRESVDLYNLASAGNLADAMEIYKWFLPLLRMDTVPKFVQLIKAVQQEIGQGFARVRAPRLELCAPELADVRAILQHALANRPKLAAVPQPA
jgi:1-pyrroline-4-hydroxy-2-carboxylate deaminase